MVNQHYFNRTMKDHGGAKRWHFDRCKEQRISA